VYFGGVDFEFIEDGWRVTTPDYGYASLGGGERRTDFLFGMTRKTVISGAVYNDANKNGVRDENESGLSGVRVYLDANNDGAFSNGDPYNLADANGDYEFNTLSAGKGTLRVEPLGGFATINPGTGSYTGTVTEGQIIPNIDFGLAKQAAAT